MRTVVLYTEGLEAPDRLDAGYLQFRVDNVYLKACDGLVALARIERHLRAAEWTVADRLDLAFLPYMRLTGWTDRDVVAKTAEIAGSIPDEEERNLAAALILLISAKNLSEEDVLRLKEGLMMTDVVKIIARDEAQKARNEGRQEGRREGRRAALVQAARNMLAGGMDAHSVSRFLGLDLADVEALQDRLQP